METKETQKILRNFYDTCGWKRDEATGKYLETILFQDQNKITQRYMDSNELRYRKYFEDGGNLFLDAACGAQPRREMAEKFKKHVCVDISLLGLMEVRKQLGDSGLYVLADLVALPFKEQSLDQVLASHCLYHINKDLQMLAIKELYRVVKTNKNILIFYASNYNLISTIHAIGKAMIKSVVPLVNILRPNRKRHGPNMIKPPPLYTYLHNPFRLTKDFNSVDITCLRTLTLWETKFLGKLRLLKIVVPIFCYLEKTFPHFMVYIGKYVTIRIQKMAA